MQEESRSDGQIQFSKHLAISMQHKLGFLTESNCFEIVYVYVYIVQGILFGDDFIRVKTKSTI